ncbi:MAG TPA: SRPBCC family protein [Thermomicrobiales bacterium]|nr:SRPBCC family protein [Thermomicrobiales bacterium]
MPSVEAQRTIDASPEAIWRVVLGFESWPEWSPLFQLVRPEDPTLGLNGEWTLNGLIGRIPYTGLFRQTTHEPMRVFAFASIRVSAPYDFIGHTVRLERAPTPVLTWRIDYAMSGGPGGWLLDRLLVRPGAAAIAERQQDALCAILAST